MDRTFGVLRFTSQNVTNFGRKDIWLIRWLARISYRATHNHYALHELEQLIYKHLQL